MDDVNLKDYNRIYERIYERTVKSLSKGRLPNSVRDYIIENKLIINERIPKAYCWNSDCQRFVPCICKVTSKISPSVTLYLIQRPGQKTLGKGRSLGYIALCTNLREKFKHDQEFVDLIKFLKVRFLRI